MAVSANGKKWKAPLVLEDEPDFASHFPTFRPDSVFCRYHVKREGAKCSFLLEMSIFNAEIQACL